MHKARIPKQHRRYSLPATSSLTPFGFRSVPEASDTFQKALEELYTSEPHHAPSRNDNSGLKGLNNIIEGDESDFVESEEDINAPSDDDDDIITINRRHSSPLFLQEQDSVDGHFKDETSVRKLHTKLLKGHSKYRKEYFAKHGHWPTVNNNKQIGTQSTTRPKSHKQVRKGKSHDASYGASTRTMTSNMAKLRV